MSTTNLDILSTLFTTISSNKSHPEMKVIVILQSATNLATKILWRLGPVLIVLFQGDCYSPGGNQSQLGPTTHTWASVWRQQKQSSKMLYLFTILNLYLSLLRDKKQCLKLCIFHSLVISFVIVVDTLISSKKNNPSNLGSLFWSWCWYCGSLLAVWGAWLETDGWWICGIRSLDYLWASAAQITPLLPPCKTYSGEKSNEGQK